MSLFDADIVEQPLLVRQVYDINIDCFVPDIFYTWVWKEKGIDYPPRFRTEATSKQVLYDILIDKLGNIPGDMFIKWRNEFVKNKSLRSFRRHFKKLVKREYLPRLTIEASDKNTVVYIPTDITGVFNYHYKCSIIFTKI